MEALDQVRREVGQRYDFKGVTWDIEFQRKEGKLILKAQDATRLSSVWDVLREKMVKRGVDLSLGPAGGALATLLDTVTGIAGHTLLEAGVGYTTVDLKVTDTAPGIKGATASAQLKPATLETGAVVQVPLFVNVGDRIKVDPREGRYISRA